MAVGPGGIGKSTIMNVLVQGSANMELDKNNNIVTKNKYLLNN